MSTTCLFYHIFVILENSPYYKGSVGFCVGKVIIFTPSLSLLIYQPINRNKELLGFRH